MKSKCVREIRSFNLVPVAPKSSEFKVVKTGLKVEHQKIWYFLTYSSTSSFFMPCARAARSLLLCVMQEMREKDSKNYGT